MRYVSTRNHNISLKSMQAIKNGLCEDGGLFVPENIPQLTDEEIGRLSFLSYNERAKYILKKFLSDFSDEEIAESVDKAYNEESFERAEVAPFVKISDDLYILELL